jgi:hypothetical protein
MDIVSKYDHRDDRDTQSPKLTIKQTELAGLAGLGFASHLRLLVKSRINPSAFIASEVQKAPIGANGAVFFHIRGANLFLHQRCSTIICD